MGKDCKRRINVIVLEIFFNVFLVDDYSPVQTYMMWNEKTPLRSDSKIPGKIPWKLGGNFEGIYSIC